MAKHWQETMFPQQCFLDCPGLEIVGLILATDSCAKSLSAFPHGKYVRLTTVKKVISAIVVKIK
jgi:hypothetical protein